LLWESLKSGKVEDEKYMEDCEFSEASIRRLLEGEDRPSTILDFHPSPSLGSIYLIKTYSRGKSCGKNQGIKFGGRMSYSETLTKDYGSFREDPTIVVIRIIFGLFFQLWRYRLCKGDFHVAPQLILVRSKSAQHLHSGAKSPQESKKRKVVTTPQGDDSMSVATETPTKPTPLSSVTSAAPIVKSTIVEKSNINPFMWTLPSFPLPGWVSNHNLHENTYGPWGNENYAGNDWGILPPSSPTHS
jgi:hypothetical protein